MKLNSEIAINNANIARRVAQEGMVLLENNSTLPLTKGTRVAIFGVGQIDYIQAGSGSGSVNAKYSVNLITGLRNSGKIKVDEDLAAIYEAYCTPFKSNKSRSAIPGETFPPTPIPEMPLSETIIAKAAVRSKIAIITFNRSSGEGRDRTLTKGDYYLTESEEDMFSKVRAHFDKVIVVLNICGVMDMSWVEAYKVDAVLLAWLPGMEGGNAMADIITGDVNPSGKLTDTFAKDYWDYPSSYNFGSFVDGYETVVADGSEIEYWGMMPNHKSHPPGTSYRRPVNNRHYVNYQEGIFIGYRYFETFGVDVRYPFGYGLSYTTFAISTDPVIVKDNKIIITVKVKNTGRVPGKEVVQVYYSAPDGNLEKPAKSLVAYAKTNLVQPGEFCTLTISYEINHMASYDEGTAAYILEAGSYDIYVGNSVKNTNKVGTYKVPSTIITQQLTNRLKLAEGIKLKTLSKFDRVGTFPTTPAIKEEAITQLPDLIPLVDAADEIKRSKKANIQLIDVYNGKAEMSDFLAQMTDLEMTALLVGTGMGSTRSMFGALSSSVPGAAGQTATLNHLGIPTIILADGPAGIRIERPCTAFPIGTLVACTWNEDLAEEMGLAVGQEAASVGVDLWLAPGLNIHRNPLCGRNFEYYSEDPLISGTIAAAVGRGVQSFGVGVTYKHFAANNQETHRYGIDTVSNEKTLREIYLKGFEIAVKSSAPWAIMTSYNAINGTYTAARKDMNVDILRKEWGHEGLVMTDWEGEGVHSVEALIAGHNLLMPGFPKQIKYVCNKMQEGTPSRHEIEQCVAGFLKTIMKTKSFARYYGITDNSNSSYNAPGKWFTAEKQNR